MEKASKLGQQQGFDISQTSEIVCENCGKKVFAQGVALRKVSALMTGTGQPGIIPIPLFYCVGCGHVNSEFLPVEMRNENKPSKLT